MGLERLVLLTCCLLSAWAGPRAGMAAVGSLEAWIFRYRCHPAGQEHVFTETARYTRIDRPDVSLIIDYGKNSVLRLEHLRQRAWVYPLAPRQETGRWLAGQLAAREIQRSGVVGRIGGWQAEKVLLRWGTTGRVPHRHMAPLSAEFFGDLIREQGIEAWVAAIPEQHAGLNRLFLAKRAVLAAHPILWRFDLPACFLFLDGLIVKMVSGKETEREVLELETVRTTPVDSDLFSVPGHYVLSRPE